MTGLDWPAGFERTPAYEREPDRKFEASLGQTTEELETELRRLDPDDWRVSIANEHTKSNGLPLYNANPDDPGFVLRWTKDGQQYAVACDAYAGLRGNVRTVYKWLHETRMRNQRPVVTGNSAFAAARLPAGDEDRDAVVQRPPHEVLDLSPDEDREHVIEAAARELKKQYHPDRPDGDRERFKRVQRAEETLLQDGGKP